ncbi:MAG: hypothetical protein KKE73_05320 [Proteobacteria bacterium]|nr:hypothetical protein [Pseudomonadota bacterium]
MLEFLFSIISGGATGLLGSLFKGVGDYFKRRQEMSHECEMRRLDMELMDKEWEYRDRAAAREGEVRMQESADDLQAASYEHDQATYSRGFKVKLAVNRTLLVLVDVVRGLTRPGLTIFMLWLIWDTRCEVQAALEAAGIERIDIAMAMDLQKRIVCTILYLATLCVAWWFGDRGRRVA